ncbi:MAG: DUF3298 domain-containing protein [Cyanobacteria bacterium SZAS-4]|nr:DUF3298 domain-containing protein [Cyanobacteria bacterium SZAS-4]
MTSQKSMNSILSTNDALSVSSSIELETPHVVSVMFQVDTMNEGAAHGGHSSVPLNYQLAPIQRTLTLQDIFGKPVDYSTLSQLCRIRLYKSLTNGGQDFVESGTKSDEPSNFACVTLNHTGITFTFNEYQVAPYSEGSPKISFTYGELRPFFSPSSPVFQAVEQSISTPLSTNKIELDQEEQQALQDFNKRIGE